MNNQLCWFENSNNLWDKGHIIDNFTVSINNSIIKTDTDKLLLRNKDEEDKQSDLLQILHLNEPTILNSVNLRYRDNKIYTFAGEILIAVNPYKIVNLYSKEIMANYNIQNSTSPHPYYVANNSLINVKRSDKNQSILISGESGAGKTQTSKIIMDYISYSSSTNTSIKDKVLSSNPLLEAFGNAKTIRNNNSSRFGKFIKLLLDKNGVLIGGKINTYLLEKIRVTSVCEKENNFHIFYILLNSLSEKEKLFYQIGNNKEYKFADNENSIYYKKEYKQLIDAFQKNNLSNESVSQIIKIISFILNLNNIEKKEDLDNIYFKKACKVFDYNNEKLRDLLLHRYLKVENENIQIENSDKEIKIAVNTLCQTYYSKLFDFIVDKINSSISCSEEQFIGILDIFGFELFETNQFEQLCINYTNEYLQNLFNKYIFKLEQKEYIAEDVPWENINYPNNDRILTSIDKTLFSLIEEQSTLKSGNDKGLFSNLEKNINEYINISNKDKVLNKFTINHYAGNVPYKVVEFINKNRNVIDNRIEEYIYETSKLFNKNSKKDSNKKTILGNFKYQLKNLIQLISETDQHYIRCIKPNDEDKADNLDLKRTYEQLKYCGILEAVKVSKAGYPIKILKQIFLKTFYILLNKQRIDLNIASIVKFLEIYKNEYFIGKTKIFLKKELHDKLHDEKRIVSINYSTKIQSYSRMFLEKIRYNKFKNSIKILQIKWKSYYSKCCNSSTMISKNYRAYITRFLYKFYLFKIILIQSNYRTFRLVKRYKRVCSSIRRIQNWIRILLDKSKKIINLEVIEVNKSEIIEVNQDNYFTIDETEEIIKQKDILIEKLLKENVELNKINKTNYDIEEKMADKNLAQAEMAKKMEELYIKLADQEREIKQRKKTNSIFKWLFG